jgi:hypothetical protein
MLTAMAATVILIEADFDGFATEVAVTHTVTPDSEAGALYVTEVAVWFVSEPQACPVHPTPTVESDHVTLGLTAAPMLLETEAVISTVWPISMIGGEAGLVMATMTEELVLVPPQPAAKIAANNPTAAPSETNFWFMAVPPSRISVRSRPPGQSPDPEFPISTLRLGKIIRPLPHRLKPDFPFTTHDFG